MISVGSLEKVGNLAVGYFSLDLVLFFYEGHIADIIIVEVSDLFIHILDKLGHVCLFFSE